MERRVASLWARFAEIRSGIVGSGVPEHRMPDYDAYKKRALRLGEEQIRNAEIWLDAYIELVQRRNNLYAEMRPDSWDLLRMMNTTGPTQTLNRLEREVRRGWQDKNNILRRTFIRGPKRKGHSPDQADSGTS